jgi:hypothetical protein
MSAEEQTNQFSDELDKLVDRFRSEYELTYAQVVGVLEMKKWLLCDEARDAFEDNSLENDE